MNDKYSNIYLQTLLTLAFLQELMDELSGTSAYNRSLKQAAKSRRGYACHKCPITLDGFAPVGNCITFGWNVSRVKNKKMKKNTIADGTTSSGTKDSKRTNADDSSFSPTGAKPSVGSSTSTKELFECTVCWGSGKIEIDDYGNEEDCTWCDGTGLVGKGL